MEIIIIIKEVKIPGTDIILEKEDKIRILPEKEELKKEK